MRTWRADEWRSARERGKAAFLLRYGVLGRGLPFGALVALAIEAALGTALPEALTSPPFLTRLVACIAVFSLSGCMRANFTWRLCEKRFGAGV
jgi:hypothetical protein